MEKPDEFSIKERTFSQYNAGITLTGNHHLLPGLTPGPLNFSFKNTTTGTKFFDKILTVGTKSEAKFVAFK